MGRSTTMETAVKISDITLWPLSYVMKDTYSMVVEPEHVKRVELVQLENGVEIQLLASLVSAMLSQMILSTVQELEEKGFGHEALPQLNSFVHLTENVCNVFG